MGQYSGLPVIYKWTVAPIAWLKTHVATGISALTMWKTELADKDKFIAKHKLVKKLR